ncbi:MAG: Cysteine desulfurase [Microgenomates group bacterium GW2011_GWC1_43_11]|nr:MAG: Cysteine desulfurase [Microgenomates group bacterium GW2011_GWC1_43_11]
MNKNRIYLDNHATTRVRFEVLEAMLPYFTEKFGNASSSTHQFGWEAKSAIEEARSNVAALIHTDPNNIVFTSGATESNNLVIKGLCESSNKKVHIISSAIEHDCVLEALKSRKNSCEYTLLPVNSEGIVEMDILKNAIKPNTALISIMFANNEIGSIQPIKKIGKLCKEKNIIFYTDAAQALGKIYIDVDDYGIDLLSASAHKFGGPKGVGFLYINRRNKNIKLTTQMSGGHQENGYRSGTLNVPGIVGLGTASKLVNEQFSDEFWHLFNLRNKLFKGLMANNTGITLNGPSIDNDKSVIENKKNMSAEELSKLLKRLPHNLHISIGKLQAADLFSRVKHIAMSSGSACSSNVATTSHVLEALGLDDERVNSSVRIGVGHYNTDEEISEATLDITSVLKALGSNNA